MGILSGLNDMAWNPERDPALSTSYSAEDPSGKDANRTSLREELNLPHEDVPLVRVHKTIGFLTFFWFWTRRKRRVLRFTSRSARVRLHSDREHSVEANPRMWFRRF